jgi:transcriptional regulator of met regulon
MSLIDLYLSKCCAAYKNCKQRSKMKKIINNAQKIIQLRLKTNKITFKDDRNIRTATYKVNSELFIYLFIYSSFYACSYISYGS